LRLETVRGLKRTLLIAMERISVFCAHRVVVVSPSLRARVLELRIAPANKIAMIASGSCNGIDLEQFAVTALRSAEASRIRAELQIPQDAQVIGFVGRLTRDKGISELLAAFSSVLTHFPEVHLILIGGFEDGDPLSKETMLLLESLKNVHQIGFISDPTPYYHVMDMLVLPSYREGFPTVPLEAAAAGKPVITTDATGARDSVIDQVTGRIVPVADAVALASAIRDLVADPKTARLYGENGFSRVQNEYSQEVIWAGLEKLYLQVFLDNTRRSQKTNQFLKRCFDVFSASFALIVLSWLLVCVYVMVFVFMRSNPLFVQIRPGINGQLFKMYKFRSMTDARDAHGALLSDAQRLTPFGRWLRASSLDELPGLWNVVRGDMSLVGPRPLKVNYLERYSPEQARRHQVPPGITGWAQVNGRNAISWTQKFEFDVWYVDHQSFWLDLKILWLTVFKVFARDGVNSSEEVPMPEFMGIPGE
jgi:lipopolysaccharide/colanic/teichoic acid biosynthesis glycosyltransferase